MITARCGSYDMSLAEFIEAAVHLSCGALFPHTLQDELGRIAAHEQVADFLLPAGGVIYVHCVIACVQQGLLQRPGLEDGPVVIVVQEGHHTDSRHMYHLMVPIIPRLHIAVKRDKII